MHTPTVYFHDRRSTRRGFIVGRTLVTLTRQGAGAPVVDGCTSIAEDDDGTVHRAGGIAIRLRPTMGFALVVARIGSRGPFPAELRRWFGDALTRPRGHRA